MRLVRDEHKLWEKVSKCRRLCVAGSLIRLRFVEPLCRWQISVTFN